MQTDDQNDIEALVRFYLQHAASDASINRLALATALESLRVEKLRSEPDRRCLLMDSGGGVWQWSIPSDAWIYKGITASWSELVTRYGVVKVFVPADEA